MKQFLAISFLLLYFLALLNPIAPYINYSLNKAEIIEKFCKNKDKPILKCEGKCHLKKQLAKAAENEEEQNKTIKTDTSYPVGSISCLELQSIYKLDTIVTIPSKNSSLKNDLFWRIDHPPQSV